MKYKPCIIRKVFFKIFIAFVYLFILYTQLEAKKVERDRLYSDRQNLEHSKRKKQGPQPCVDPNRIQHDLLMKANVICCTLTGSGNPVLQSYSPEQGNHRSRQGQQTRRQQMIRFKCVIVDEVSV